MKPFEEKIRYIDLLEKFIALNRHILSRDFQNISAEISVYIKNKSRYKDENDYARQVLLSHYPEMFFHLERLYYAIAEHHRPLDPKYARFLRFQIVPETAKNLLSLQEQPNGQSWLKNIFSKIDASVQAKKRDIKVLAFSVRAGLNVYEIGFEMEKALPENWDYTLTGMSFIPDHLASSKNAVFPISLFPPGYVYKDNFVKEGETYRLPESRIGNTDFQLVRLFKEDTLILKEKYDIIVLWGANQFYSLPVIHRIIEKCIPLLEPGGIIIPGIQQFDEVMEFDACDILWVDKQFYYRRNNNAIIQRVNNGEGIAVSNETPDNLYTFAMAQLLEGDHKRVLDYTHMIFKKRVDHRDTIILKSIAQIDMDDLAGALHTVQQALMINPNDFDACLIKSFINLKRNKIRDAERELHRAINHFNFNKLYNIIPVKPSDEQLFFARWLKVENLLKKIKLDQKDILPDVSKNENESEQADAGHEKLEFHKREQMKEYQQEREALSEKPIPPISPEHKVEDRDQGTVSIIRDIESRELTEKVLPDIKEKTEIQQKEKTEIRRKETSLPFKTKKKKKTDKAPETTKMIETVVAETLEKELSGKIRDKKKAKEAQEALETSEAEKPREFSHDVFKVVDIKKPEKRTETEIQSVTTTTSEEEKEKQDGLQKKLSHKAPGKPAERGKVLKVFISGAPTGEGIMEEVVLTENLTPTEILRRDSLPESGMLEEFSQKAPTAKPPFGKIKLPRPAGSASNEASLQKTRHKPEELSAVKREKSPPEAKKKQTQAQPETEPSKKASAKSREIEKEIKDSKKYSFKRPEELSAVDEGQQVKIPLKTAPSVKVQDESTFAPQLAFKTIEEILGEFEQPQDETPKTSVKPEEPEKIIVEKPKDITSVSSPDIAAKKSEKSIPSKKADKPVKSRRETGSFKTKELKQEDGKVSDIASSRQKEKLTPPVVVEKIEPIAEITTKPSSPPPSMPEKVKAEERTHEIKHEPEFLREMEKTGKESASSHKKEKNETADTRKPVKISQEKIQSGEIDIEALLLKDRKTKHEGDISKVGIIIEDTDTREIKRAYMIKAKKTDTGRKTREIVRVDQALAEMEKKTAKKPPPKKGKPREIIRYVKGQADPGEDKKFYETR